MKHDNYENPCEIVITRLSDDEYTLYYPQESYEYTASTEEILAEIAGHLELMVLKPKHTMLEAVSSLEEGIDTIAMNELGITREEVEKIKGAKNGQD